MFEQYIKSGRETLEYLRKYREIAVAVKEIAKGDYEGVKAYVFGSTVKGEFTASSDIDILLVLNEVDKEEATELKAKILRRMGFRVPLQIHVATQSEFEEWYLKFIDELMPV